MQRDAENINSISYDPIRETRGQGTAPEFPEQALKAGDESKRADPALEAVLRGEAIDCIGPSGTAVLMNTGSAHAGTARHTDRQRRTIHVYAVGAHYLPFAAAGGRGRGDAAVLLAAEPHRMSEATQRCVHANVFINLVR